MSDKKFFENAQPFELEMLDKMEGTLHFGMDEAPEGDITTKQLWFKDGYGKFYLLANETIRNKD